MVEAEKSAEALPETIVPGRLRLAGGKVSWPASP
jgi:hypothetical protein